MSCRFISRLLNVSANHVERVCLELIKITAFNRESDQVKKDAEMNSAKKIEIQRQTKEALEVMTTEQTLRESAGLTVKTRIARIYTKLPMTHLNETSVLKAFKAKKI